MQFKILTLQENSPSTWITRRHSTITGAPTANNGSYSGDLKRESNGYATNNINYSGSIQAIQFGSFEKLTNEKKLWPAPAHVVRDGSKTSVEREIDLKLTQNKAQNRPVVLNIGGTSYEVFEISFFKSDNSSNLKCNMQLNM